MKVWLFDIFYCDGSGERVRVKEIGVWVEGWRREWMDLVRVFEGSLLMDYFWKLWFGIKKGIKGWWEDWESGDLEMEI